MDDNIELSDRNNKKNPVMNSVRSILPGMEYQSLREFGDKRLGFLDKHLKFVLILIVAAFGSVGMVTSMVLFFRGVENECSDFSFKPGHFADRYATPYTVESLTRDIDVIPIHSHNDYWRHEPLFDALRTGAKSVEADIWLFDKDPVYNNDELYVGHNRIFLNANKTLNSLYLDPLWDLLQDSNDLDRFQSYISGDEPAKFGVYYNEPETSLFLFIDLKTEGARTLAKLEAYLKRFVDAGYLTYFDVQKNTMVQGPITVITTGNTPVDHYDTITDKRITFPDAPLDLFADYEANKDLLEKYKKYSIIASCDMARAIPGIGERRYETNQKDIDQLTALIDTNHKNGLQTRIWGFPNWPKYIRNDLWKVLIESGIDLLNVDDLKDAKRSF